MAITTWRDHPTGPPEEPGFERRCVDCELWHKVPCCGLVGGCGFIRDYTDIGEGCAERAHS